MRTNSGRSGDAGLTTLGILVSVLVLLLVGVGAILLISGVERVAFGPLAQPGATPDPVAQLERALRRLASRASLERRGEVLVVLLPPDQVERVRQLTARFGPYELTVSAEGPGGPQRLVVADDVVNNQRNLRMPTSALAALGTAGQLGIPLTFTLTTGSQKWAATGTATAP